MNNNNIMNRNIMNEIKKILDDNKIDDLNRFLEKRKCLNNCNMFLVYIFHTIQSAGILTTTIATGYDIKYMIWVGVGLNILASLINIFEHTNNTISNKLLKSIDAINNNNYLDEDIIVNTEKDSSNNTSNI